MITIVAANAIVTISMLFAIISIIIITIVNNSVLINPLHNFTIINAKFTGIFMIVNIINIDCLNWVSFITIAITITATIALTYSKITPIFAQQANLNSTSLIIKFTFLKAAFIIINITSNLARFTTTVIITFSFIITMTIAISITITIIVIIIILVAITMLLQTLAWNLFVIIHTVSL